MQTTEKFLLTFLLLLFGASLCFSQAVKCSNCGGESGGENPDAIDIHFPPCGKVGNEALEFRWSRKKGARSYTVELKESMPDGSSTLIHSEETANTAILVGIPELGLTLGKEYSITIESDNNRRSNEATFVVKSMKEKELAHFEATNDIRFGQMSGPNKHLRMATLLRQQNWNLDAMKSYNIEVDNLIDIIRVKDDFDKFVNSLFPEGADGCEGM